MALLQSKEHSYWWNTIHRSRYKHHIDNTDPANPVVSSTGGGGIIHLIIILQEWLTSIPPKKLYQEFHKRIRLLSKLI